MSLSFFIFPLLDVLLLRFITIEDFRKNASRFLNCVHAVISGGYALYYCWNNALFRSYERDCSFIRYRDDEQMRGMIDLMTGYLIGDLFLSYILASPFSILIHHFIGAIALSLVRITGFGYLIAVYFMLTELTTPFLQISKYRAEQGKKTGIFGILLVISYIFIRILPIPYLLVLAYQIYVHKEEYSAMAWMGILTIPGLAMLNLMWFRLIIRKVTEKTNDKLTN